MKHTPTLHEKYPPSLPCGCSVCLNYCRRPGWWTVAEACKAIEAGYAHRMMLEIAPELSFGVVAPAFYGCEGGIALRVFSKNGCNFLKDNRCELHGTPFMPLECRYCHHSRIGLGPLCHHDIEMDWMTTQGQAVVESWGRITGLWERMKSMQ